MERSSNVNEDKKEHSFPRRIGWSLSWVTDEKTIETVTTVTQFIVKSLIQNDRICSDGCGKIRKKYYEYAGNIGPFSCRAGQIFWRRSVTQGNQFSRGGWADQFRVFQPPKAEKTRLHSQVGRFKSINFEKFHSQKKFTDTKKRRLRIVSNYCVFPESYYIVNIVNERSARSTSRFPTDIFVDFEGLRSHFVYSESYFEVGLAARFDLLAMTERSFSSFRYIF